MKEVEEETGIHCEPVRLLAVIDGMRMGFTRFGMYMLLFHCRAVGGELTAHPLETSGVGWFAEDDLPGPIAGFSWWGPRGLRRHPRRGPLDVQFDAAPHPRLARRQLTPTAASDASRGPP